MQLDELERYELTYRDGMDAGMEVMIYGEWVRFEDVDRLVNGYGLMGIMKSDEKEPKLAKVLIKGDDRLIGENQQD